MQFLLATILFISSAAALPNDLAARGIISPPCLVPPYLYGCGTTLKPRCCTEEEYDALHSSNYPTPTTTSDTASATGDLYGRGVGPACVVPPYTCGCGTAFAPRCCTQEECDAGYGSS